MCEARKLANALRGHFLGDITCKRWWEKCYPRKEFLNEKWQNECDLGAVIAGFIGEEKRTPAVVPITQKEAFSCATTEYKSLGMTYWADGLLDQYLPRNREDRTPYALTYLAVLCVLATFRYTRFIDDDVKVVHVLRDRIEHITGKPLESHKALASQTLDSWMGEVEKHMQLRPTYMNPQGCSPTSPPPSSDTP